MTDPRPLPLDAELIDAERGFQAFLAQAPLRGDTIQAHREHFAIMSQPLDPAAWPELELFDREIDGGVAVAVASPREPGTGRPAYLSMHGGGMMVGTRHFSMADCAAVARDFDAVAVSVEYRLAPEDPYPAQLEDCHTALRWMVEHADELGIDATRIIIGGASAGGGLAAALALHCRDRGEDWILAQLLDCPMLDDRGTSASIRQYGDTAVWSESNNIIGWGALKGDRDDVPHTLAPARAEHLGGLPPAFIDVGEAEIFRDEATEYASRIWADGGDAELHVWAGAFHGFAGFAPDSLVGQASRRARASWLERMWRHGRR